MMMFVNDIFEGRFFGHENRSRTARPGKMPKLWNQQYVQGISGYGGDEDSELDEERARERGARKGVEGCGPRERKAVTER